MRFREKSAAELLLERALWDLVRLLYRYDPITHAWVPLRGGTRTDHEMNDLVQQAIR
jgi:hypothetical protein